MSASELEQIRLEIVNKAKRAKNTMFISSILIISFVAISIWIRVGAGAAAVFLIAISIVLIWLESLGKNQPSMAVNKKISIIIASILFICIVSSGTKTDSIAQIPFGIAAFLIMIFYVPQSLARRTDEAKRKEYKKFYKAHYLAPYIKDLGYKYDIFGKIGQIYLRTSKLFRSFRYLGGNDRISGVYDGVRFAFCDVCLHQLGYDEPDLGLFFYAEFNKRISAKTMIFPACAGAPNTLGLKKIDMDDAEFNAAFAVYSADAAGAMYILTPAFMRRLLRFAGAVAAPVSLSFADSKIYIFVNTGRDNFEPDIGESVLRRDPAALIKRELSHFLAIVKNLKLNERIWS